MKSPVDARWRAVRDLIMAIIAMAAMAAAVSFSPRGWTMMGDLWTFTAYCVANLAALGFATRAAVKLRQL